MKKFHENLLIVLALGLCALCAWQWYGQTGQRNEIDKLNRLVNEKTLAIQSDTNSLQNAQQEISELSARISELKTALKTNESFQADQKREIHRLMISSGQLTSENAQYKQAFDDAQASLKEAYEGIRKQNAAFEELTTQRNDLVNKYNESVKDRNDIVAKYNALVERVEKMQGAAKTDK